MPRVGGQIKSPHSYGVGDQRRSDPAAYQSRPAIPGTHRTRSAPRRRGWRSAELEEFRVERDVAMQLIAGPGTLLMPSGGQTHVRGKI